MSSIYAVISSILAILCFYHDLFSIVVTNHIGYKNKILKLKNFEHTCNFSPNICKISWYKSQFHLISKLFTALQSLQKSLIQIQTEKKVRSSILEEKKKFAVPIDL